MKQEQNNEMDLLLRNLGRTAGTGLQIEEQEAQHLDADELNAFAEKALPARAQARYTKHIADCDRCRSLVSELSVAAGVITEDRKSVPVVAPSGLKAFLANLFSPAVLRYAVPALALLIVAFIGFSMLQRRAMRTDEVASNKQGEVARNEPVQPGPVNGVSSTSSQPTSQSNNQRPSETATDAKKEKQEDVADTPSKDANAKQPVSPPVDQVSTTSGSEAAGNAAAPPPAPKPTVVAAQEPAPMKVKPAEQPAETVTVADDRKRQAEPEAKGSQKINPNVSGLAMGDANQARSKTEAAKRRVAAERDEEEVTRSKEPKSADKDSGETRSVSGRRFRKEGSAWVDVAYNSQATTNVSRGSEQYRALVADEPGIKTIADQLGGEVIVVWKGRAYKIK